MTEGALMLDLKTIYFMMIFLYSISSATIFVLWRAHRSRYTGIGFWSVGLAVQTLGYVLVALRGILPDIISITIANPVVFSGVLILMYGLEKFFGVDRSLWAPNAILIALSALLFYYFSTIHPILQMRSIAVSAMGLILYGQIALLLSQRVPASMKKISRSTAKFFFHFIVAALLGLTLLIFFPEKTNDFFKSQFSSILTTLMLFTLSVFQPISLVLTVNRRLNADMEDETIKFDKAFYSAPYGIILSKLDTGIITEVNRNSEMLFGLSGDDLIGKSLYSLSIWTKGPEQSAIMTALKRGEKLESRELIIRKSDNSEISTLFSATPIEIRGEPYCISSFNDISEITEMRRKLQYLATHDVLTGLPNRLLFNERFKADLAEAKRRGTKLAVLIGDINNFKSINDRFGHLEGDHVLKEMGKRLSAALLECDMVARIGGDEYAVIFCNATSKDELLEREKRILVACADDLRIGNRSISITMSIGCAMYPDHGSDQDMLMRRADSEMYGIKKLGGENQLTCNLAE